MHDEHDAPLNDEELALARKGEALISAAAADVHAPQSLREAVERDRERAANEGPRAVLAPPLTEAGRGCGRHRRAGRCRDCARCRHRNPTEPTQAKVQSAARLDPTDPAPASIGGTPPVVDVKVGAHNFPDWTKKFGWKATGHRRGRALRPHRHHRLLPQPQGRTTRLRHRARRTPRRPRTRSQAHPRRQGLQRRPNGSTDNHHLDPVGPHLRHRRLSTVPESKLVDLAASRNA